MSIVNRAWALITGFFLATLCLSMGLVVSQLKGHFEDELAARSQAAARAAAALHARVAANDNTPLASYGTLLREQAAAGGWQHFEIIDREGVTVVPAQRGPQAWGERLVLGWHAASATATVGPVDKPFGTVRVWVSADDLSRLVERSAATVLGTFVVLGALLILALWRLLRWAHAPLLAFEDQIQGLAERRFVQLREPASAEWAPLSRALNVTVARVRQMLEERDLAVDGLRHQLAEDALTHTASRPEFMGALATRLRESVQGGCIAIVRVHDLDGMNRRVGRGRADEFLVAVATTMRARLMLAGAADTAVVARLNGADFGLLLECNDETAARELLQDLAGGLAGLASDGVSDSPHAAWVGATLFRQDEPTHAVLLRADNMVMRAEALQEPVGLALPGQQVFTLGVAQWRVLIETALDTGRFTLAFTPLCMRDGTLIHRQAELQLTEPDGSILLAPDLVPPAIRNGRILALDLRAVELALMELSRSDGQLAVAIAVQSLTRPIFMRNLTDLLQRHEAVASRLNLELDERGFDGRQFESAVTLRKAVKPFGCSLGIAGFGVSLSMLPFLSAAQADYVKLAPELLLTLEHGGVRAPTFVGQLTTLAQRVGVPVHAVGVALASQLPALEALGVQGFSGPALQALEHMDG